MQSMVDFISPLRLRKSMMPEESKTERRQRPTHSFPELAYLDGNVDDDDDESICKDRDDEGI